MEKEKAVLERLGYTVEEICWIHTYPETRSSERSSIDLCETIAYKGVKPDFEGTYHSCKSEPKFVEEFKLRKVYKEEFDKFLYDLFLNSATRKNLKGKEIKCTGNNDNGCFMDSCGHDCGCEGIVKSAQKE